MGIIKISKIKSIKKIDYKGKVYDLSLDEDHLFYSKSNNNIDVDQCFIAKNAVLVHNSQADIDVDYMADTDHITNEFLYKKYGKDRILNVGTFSTFNERGCLKDVIRSLYGKEQTGVGSIGYQISNEMPNFDKDKFEVNGVSKKVTLEEWFEIWPKEDKCSEEVREFLTDPNNKKVLSIVVKLQGQVRGIGQHAAGIVITPGKSWDCIPTNIIKKEKGDGYSLVTAFQEADKSGKDLSALGILKLDRLKLKTLNIVKSTIDLIKEKSNVDITDNINYINLDDKNLYEELKLGLNHGIFQFESPGMNALIKGISVDNFSELTACNALYRPGPMGIGAHKEYMDNKFKPDQIKYIHESLREILEESNGVLIYQEQLMFIASRIGDMSLGDGDSLRRAMDKASKIIEKEVNGEELTEEERNNKDYKSFVEVWGNFLKGAERNGLKEEELNELKAYLIKYLGYSFNKCITKNHVVISKERGEINLLDVKIGEEIECFNTRTLSNEFNKVKDIHKNGKKKVYLIQTQSGYVLECTPDHKIMTRDGMVTLRDIIDNKLKIKTNEYYVFESIIKFEEIEQEEETYDLEIDSEDHNYYANGICVSNSHSVAYAYLATQTLYLKHYYPTEFYTSLLNHCKSSGKPEEIQKWIATTIMCAISKDIKILPPSRKSGWDWTMTGDKEISMGLSSINGFGDVSYQELRELLKEKNKKFEDISKYAFFDLRFSKYSKTAFESSLKAGLFDDWSPSREELADLFQKSKKSNKKQVPNQLSLFGSSYEPEMKHNEFKYKKITEEEKNNEFMEVCNFDLNYIQKIYRIKHDISERAGREINSINDYAEKDYYWFILESASTQKTKTGKKYLTLKVTDGILNTYLRIFGNDVKDVEDILEDKGIYVGLFEKNQQGFLNFAKIFQKQEGSGNIRGYKQEGKIYLRQVDKMI